MANKQFMCLKDCFRKNPTSQWKLYRAGDTEWFDEDIHKPSPKHWAAIHVGEPQTAQDILKRMCIELGIEIGKDWDLGRLQREYDHKREQMFAEQNKQVMSKSSVPPDAKVSQVSVQSTKGK